MFFCCFPGAKTVEREKNILQKKVKLPPSVSVFLPFIKDKSGTGEDVNSLSVLMQRI